MTDTAGSVTSGTLEEILRDVWSAYLSTVDEAAPSSTATVPELRGSVSVSGTWQGYVDLAFSGPTARVVAAAMLLMPDDTLTEQDVRDAVGELANIVGGNVKSLLPAPTTLSIPEVVAGSAPARSSGLHLVAEATLGELADPVVARVWTVTSASSMPEGSQEMEEA